MQHLFPKERRRCAMAIFVQHCEKCDAHFANAVSASEHLCPVESLSSNEKVLSFLRQAREEKEKEEKGKGDV